MKRLFLFVLALTLAVAVLACLHLAKQSPDTAGRLRINGELISISSLPFETVTGTVVNGRGEETDIHAPGLSLSVLFSSDVRIEAADSYHAEVSAGELDRAFLLLDGEDICLVVFGDTDAKRHVKKVTELNGTQRYSFSQPS